MLCAVALGAAALAGCTSGRSDGGTGAGPTGSSPTSGGPSASAGTGTAPLDVWREYVACARTHGHRNMPDPVVEADGTATFPVLAGFNEKDVYRDQAVTDACGSILDRLPPRANPLGDELTPEDLAALREYVVCLRQHGMTDMPDPGPNGEINEPQKYFREPANATRNAARDACDHILLAAQ